MTIYCDGCNIYTAPIKIEKEKQAYKCSRCQHRYMDLRVNMYLKDKRKQKDAEARKRNNNHMTQGLRKK